LEKRETGPQELETKKGKKSAALDEKGLLPEQRTESRVAPQKDRRAASAASADTKRRNLVRARLCAPRWLGGTEDASGDREEGPLFAPGESPCRRKEDNGSQIS